MDTCYFLSPSEGQTFSWLWLCCVQGLWSLRDIVQRTRCKQPPRALYVTRVAQVAGQERAKVMLPCAYFGHLTSSESTHLGILAGKTRFKNRCQRCACLC